MAFLTSLVFVGWLIVQVRVLRLQQKKCRVLNPFFVLELVPLTLIAVSHVVEGLGYPDVFSCAYVALAFLHTCYLLSDQINLLQMRAIRWIRLSKVFSRH